MKIRLLLPLVLVSISASCTGVYGRTYAGYMRPELSGTIDPGPTPDLEVAIIVPTYCDSGFLADALASVAAQTYPHWTCYVVDDASPQDVSGVVDHRHPDDAWIPVDPASRCG